jgi:RNA polymerase sigma-70 factor (ECF subfamily)
MAAPTGARTPLASLHDVEVAALAAAGERDAFGELVRRHGSAVRALLRRMGAEAALADDLAQDAFLAAYERIAEFRGEGAFAGWIKRIAARLYLKRWKRRARLDPVAEVDLDQASDDLRHGEGGAAQRLDLDSALATLSEAERLCVSLCYGAGLSHTETAQTLNVPLGTVKSHVKRGMDKLKQRLMADDGAADRAGRRTHG